MIIEKRPHLIIGQEQMARLENMATAQLPRNPVLADLLLEELSRATVVADSALPSGVVRVGSRILYQDESKGTVEEIRLTWPEDANISEGKISILTPLGVALIGLPQGARFFWQTRRDAQRKLRILQVSQ